MKEKLKLMMLAVGILLTRSVAFADDDIHIGYSELPQKAKVFIEKHFGTNTPTMEIEYENAAGIYVVELKNGYDLKFNSEGRVIEIDSPDRTEIAESIVKDILPAKAVVFLADEKMLDDVEEIKVHRNGDFIVDIDKLMNDEKLRFDSNGNLKMRKK